MNRRQFLGALAVVPAVVACPALAKAELPIECEPWRSEGSHPLFRGELGHWENVRIIGNHERRILKEAIDASYASNIPLGILMANLSRDTGRIVDYDRVAIDRGGRIRRIGTATYEQVNGRKHR